jgi:hypothetical protein
MKCSYLGCDNDIRRNDLCDGHSQQLRKHGHLTKLNKTPKDRFLDNIIKTDYCWQWTGSFVSPGYGRIMVNGKTVKAHRFSYMLYKGEIPDGMLVRHICHNKACVNPEHLLTGTPKENTQDSVCDGRMSHGESHWKAKLTAVDVQAILKDSRIAQSIANDYGISNSTVLRIKRGEIWKSVSR